MPRTLAQLGRAPPCRAARVGEYRQYRETPRSAPGCLTGLRVHDPIRISARERCRSLPSAATSGSAQAAEHGSVTAQVRTRT